MIAWLLRYGVALHLALLVAYTSWARGGSAPAYFWALPWLCLGILEFMWLVPQTRRSEKPGEAFNRLRRAVVHDPVLYLGAVLLVFLTLQWLNGPRELEYVKEAAMWVYRPPPWPGLPFCVVRAEAVQVLLWAMAVVSVLLAVRHGLNRAGKLLLLKLIVINGALLALLGLVQFASGTEKLFWVRPMNVFFFSTFGYPNHAGAYFVLLSIINGGLLLHALSTEEEKRFILPLGTTLVLNVLGLTFSLSRAAIVLGWGAMLIGGVYGLIYLWPRLDAAAKVKLFSVSAVLLGLGAALLYALPDSPLRGELGTIDLLTLHTQFLGDRRTLAQGALQIWQDNPWVGVGGWGFRRFVPLVLGQEQWEWLKTAGRANVHNDPLQYLCEHGIIGAGLILAILFTLVAPLVFRLVRLPAADVDEEEKPRTWFMRVSPIVWALVAGTTATVVHSLIDLPFRSVAVIVVWFIALACAPAFVPQRKSVPAASWTGSGRWVAGAGRGNVRQAGHRGIAPRTGPGAPHP